MRLPVDPLPLVKAGVAEDVYDIRQPAQVAPSRPIAERSLPPLLTYRPVPLAKGKEATQESGPQPQPAVERRSGEDRRKADRRVSSGQVLLDTRTGRDRRKGPRRKDDPVTGIDKVV